MQRSTINYKYGLKLYDSHIIRAYTFATNAAGRGPWMLLSVSQKHPLVFPMENTDPEVQVSWKRDLSFNSLVTKFITDPDNHNPNWDSDLMQ